MDTITPNVDAMTNEQIKHMVDRFLGWKLPENFSPDAGISFKPTFNDHLPTPTRHEPIGTNLFDAAQAEAMVRYMVKGMPAARWPDVQVIPPAEAKPWEAIADGDFAIVELMGHTTLVGRIAEVERFGTKMLAIEPLFNGALLGAVFQGGSAIYRLTPCTRQIAWEKQPRDDWQLPPSIRSTVPAALLPSAPLPERYSGRDDDDGDDDEPNF